MNKVLKQISWPTVVAVLVVLAAIYFMGLDDYITQPKNKFFG